MKILILECRMADMAIETGEIAGIIFGSAAGLTALFFAGRAILRGLGLWKVPYPSNNNNRSSSPAVVMGGRQNSNLDQRPVVRQVQHGGTRHRRRLR